MTTISFEHAEDAGAALREIVNHLCPPAGLGRRSPDSAALAWSKAMGGAQPTKYEVFEDGGLIASVAGTATSYRVGGLSPDEHHSFRLIAMSGKEHSPASTTSAIPGK